MAIIRPSKKFIGSEMQNNSGANYIREDVRRVLFNKTTNKDGVHLYILPAYKSDANGDGVWFKVIRVRDNFGDKFKDKYVVLDGVDPAAHFERNFKLYYPDEAVVTDEMNDKTGRTMKKYPNYGRVTSRVVYNVAYANDMEKGAHVLDLPQYNGASMISKWMEGTDSRGRARPQINDHKRCIPVFFKLNDGGGAPWQIEPDATDPCELPEQLADSDYLYNLDDIYVRKTAQEIVGKLKDMYTADVFEQCMAGYPGFSDSKASTGSNPVEKSSAPEKPAKGKPAPAMMNIPKVSNPTKASPPPIEDNPEVRPESEDDGNPLASATNANLKSFLNA